MVVIRSALLGLVTLLLTTAPRPAQADEVPFSFGPEAGWQLLGGLTTGVGFGDPDLGGYVGGELSLNRLNESLWFGLYGDALYDFGPDSTMLTVGPQLGYSVLGIDGGLAARHGDGEWLLGPQGRVLLSLGFFSLYGRLALFDDDGDDIQVWQVGMLLKMPLWASE
ncbi:MAG: hypothetical protein ACE366_01830 [Bradymonadia bacterium]